MAELLRDAEAAFEAQDLGGAMDAGGGSFHSLDVGDLGDNLGQDHDEEHVDGEARYGSFEHPVLGASFAAALGDPPVDVVGSGVVTGARDQDYSLDETVRADSSDGTPRYDPGVEAARVGQTRGEVSVGHEYLTITTRGCD